MTPMIGQVKSIDVSDLGHALFTEGGDALFLYDPDSDQILEVNPATERLTGFSRQELLAKTSTFLLRFSDVDRQQRLNKAAQETTFFHGQEGYFLRTKSDVWIPINLTISRLHMKPKTLCLVMARDMREQYQAHTRLQKVESELRHVLSSVSDCLWSAVISGEGQWSYRYISPVIEKITGQPPVYFAANLRQWLQVIHPEDRKRWNTMHGRLRAGQSMQDEFRILRPDGQLRWLRNSVIVSKEGDNAPLKLNGVITDITERKQTEEELRESQRFIKSIAESSPHILYVFDVPDQRIVYHNRPILGDLGYTSRQMEEMRPDFWIPLMHPDDREQLPANLARWQTAQDGQILDMEYRLKHADGSWRWFVCRESVFRRDPDGRVRQIIGTAQDITAKRQLEEQFLQAQKMEAVGRLAGGIAHDFNNLLTVILGFGEMALDSLTAEQPAYSLLEEIQKSGQRAAHLTRQLLAFSRKQMLQPVVLDLNEVVAQMEMMLHRLLGEHIEITAQLAADLHRVKADLGQIEQVVMNLAVNARDAMPKGGRLTIETANVPVDEPHLKTRADVEPTNFVRLTVRDTGCGMDTETLAHVFEPFFTTKGVGKGTGLGLATVYGIVKQSGGVVQVESAAGQGTAFHVYLPRVMETSSAILRERESSSSLRGTGAVLLVEDEHPLRRLARQVLERYGYTVFDAASGSDAIEFMGNYTGPLRLLITDVIMPGMNGRELADRLRQNRPDLQVLFISGYSDEVLGQEGHLDPGMNLLQKPFTPEALAVRVRAVMRAAGNG